MDILQWIRDWWHIVVFLFTTIIAFVLGRAKQAWKIDILAGKVTDIERRVSTVEKSLNDEAITLAEIKGSLTMIVKSLEALQADIKDKADKR